MWPQSWGGLEFRGLSRPAPAAAVLLFSEGGDHPGLAWPGLSFKSEGGGGGGEQRALGAGPARVWRGGAGRHGVGWCRALLTARRKHRGKHEVLTGQ